MRTIPQIRARLHELAEEHGLPELAELAEETKRRSPARRARKQNATYDPAEVREYAEAFPDLPYHELANAFGITIGRVSEAIAGKR